MNPRVLLVEDDAMARQAVATVVGADPGLHVAGTAGDGDEALAWLRAHTADVVLLDIRMPRRDGIATLAGVRQEWPALPVVMLTTFSDGDLVSRALSGGASGFLLKTCSPAELTEGVHAALRGELALSPRVARWLVEAWTPGQDAARDARTRLGALTARQRDVLDELASGSSNAEIATELGLTEATVKGYVSEVLAALGARNRVEAALLAFRAERG